MAQQTLKLSMQITPETQATFDKLIGNLDDIKCSSSDLI